MVQKTKAQRRVKLGKDVVPQNKGVVSRARKIKALKAKKEKVGRRRSAPRLFMKASLASFRRGLHSQNKNVAILRVDDVNTQQDAEFYAGKRCCYVYHGYKVKRGVRWAKAPARRSCTRAIWGRVTKPHGASGAIRAKFTTDLPAAALGKRVRVYLYPSKI